MSMLVGNSRAPSRVATDKDMVTSLLGGDENYAMRFQAAHTTPRRTTQHTMPSNTTRQQVETLQVETPQRPAATTTSSAVGDDNEGGEARSPVADSAVDLQSVVSKARSALSCARGFMAQHVGGSVAAQTVAAAGVASVVSAAVPTRPANWRQFGVREVRDAALRASTNPPQRPLTTTGPRRTLRDIMEGPPREEPHSSDYLGAGGYSGPAGSGSMTLAHGSDADAQIRRRRKERERFQMLRNEAWRLQRLGVNVDIDMATCTSEELRWQINTAYNELRRGDALTNAVGYVRKFALYVTLLNRKLGLNIKALEKYPLAVNHFLNKPLTRIELDRAVATRLSPDQNPIKYLAGGLIMPLIAAFGMHLVASTVNLDFAGATMASLFNKDDPDVGDTDQPATATHIQTPPPPFPAAAAPTFAPQMNADEDSALFGF